MSVTLTVEKFAALPVGTLFWSLSYEHEDKPIRVCGPYEIVKIERHPHGRDTTEAHFRLRGDTEQFCHPIAHMLVAGIFLTLEEADQFLFEKVLEFESDPKRVAAYQAAQEFDRYEDDKLDTLLGKIFGDDDDEEDEEKYGDNEDDGDDLDEIDRDEEDDELEGLF